MATFNFEEVLKQLQSGKLLTGLDGILTPLIKQLTEAALQAQLDQHLVQQYQVHLMPVLPPVKERLDSSTDRQMMTTAQPSDSISQNVGDRSIAHTITGGLRMRRTWES